MSFKFNWGTGIFLFIALFLLSMALLVYFSLQQSNDLVETGYYPQSLEYQKQIDRIANAKALSGSILIEQGVDALILKYPADFSDKVVKGKVFLFRPSDQAADFTDSLQFDTTLIQRIPIEKFSSGKYSVKISWEMDGREYYHEQSVRILK